MRTLGLIAAALALSGLVGGQTAAPFFQEKYVVRGTEFLPERYDPALAIRRDGSLVCAWVEAPGKAALDSRIKIAVKPRRAAGWGLPITIARDPSCPDGHPRILNKPGAGLRVLYSTFFRDTRKAPPGVPMGSWHLVFRDWDESGALGAKHFLMPEADRVPSGRVIAFESGSLLLPLSDLRAMAPRFLLSEDGGGYWRDAGTIPESSGLVDPVVAELEPGHLLALLRPSESGTRRRVVWRAESRDGARTWSVPQPSDLPNPGGPVDVLKLRNGHLVFVHNDHAEWLTPLTARISTDGGASWPYNRDLVTEQWDQRDPSIVEGPGGRIHIVYVSRNIHVKHLEMDESWIRGVK